MMEKCKGHWACPKCCCLLSELRRRHQNSWRPPSMYCLLSFTFVTFFLFFGLYPLLLLVLVMSLHTFTLLMTIRNALWTMRLLYSLTFYPNYNSYSTNTFCLICISLPTYITKSFDTFLLFNPSLGMLRYILHPIHSMWNYI